MDQHAMRATLRSLFPPGDEDLFAWDNPTSWVARELEAIASAVRVLGVDAVDRLRTELRPHTATEKVPDWERVFSLATSRGALYGDLAQRRNQIVARWREHGASTLANIRASLVPLCGYAPEVLEQERSARSLANRVDLPGAPITVAANASTSVVVAVADNAPASQAGAQLLLVLSIDTLEDLDVELVAPDATTVSWTRPFGSGVASFKVFVLYAPAMAGARVDGAWTLTITNNGGNVGTISSGSAMLVEGIGIDEITRAEGYAAPIFYWSVLVNQWDPSFAASTFDRRLATEIVQHWNPAHCRGWLAMYNSQGGRYMACDDSATPADGGICS